MGVLELADSMGRNGRWKDAGRVEERNEGQDEGTKGERKEER